MNVSARWPTKRGKLCRSSKSQISCGKKVWCGGDRSDERADAAASGTPAINLARSHDGGVAAAPERGVAADYEIQVRCMSRRRTGTRGVWPCSGRRGAVGWTLWGGPSCIDGKVPCSPCFGRRAQYSTVGCLRLVSLNRSGGTLEHSGPFGWFPMNVLLSA
jgi:hypothetical protein